MLGSLTREIKEVGPDGQEVYTLFSGFVLVVGNGPDLGIFLFVGY